MKNMRPVRRARRQQRKLERPKSDKPRCVLCIEMDHVAGEEHDSLLKFPLCQKHHDEVTDGRRDAEISMEYEPDPIKRVALALKATSVFLHMLADALWRWAELLSAQTTKSIHRIRPRIPAGPYKRPK